MPPRSSLAAATALVLIISGCGAGGTVDVSALRVTTTETLGLPAGELRLSPDGNRVLVVRGGSGMCVSRLDGSDQRCLDQERDRVAPDNLNARWSPDSTRVVFTNDFWQRFIEPDVWVWHVESGELRNLTDDGVDRFDIGKPSPDAQLDLLPSWAPDGETIRFARQRADDEQTIDLLMVGVDDGSTRKLRSVEGDIRLLAGLAWSSGAQGKVAWTLGQVNEATVRLGDAAGGNDRVVAENQEGHDGMGLSFSPDGGYLLVDSYAPYMQYVTDPDRFGLARVVPVGGGDPVEVARDTKVAFPTWSPDGHALAFLTGDDSLRVVAEPGGQPKELHKGNAYTAPDRARLGWTPNQILLISERKPTLVRLSDE